MSPEGLRSVRQGSTRPFGARELDGGRSMYLPAEWGSQTQETTLLGDSATTTRRAGLGCAQKGSSVDQDERLQLEVRISRDLNRPPSL